MSLFRLTEVSASAQDFCNTLLEGGDAAVLVAPRLDFAKELKRMNLVQPRFTAQPPAGNYSDQTIDAESDDLRAALKRRKIADNEAEEIIQSHQRERKELAAFLQAIRDYRARLDGNEAGGNQSEPAGPPPDFPIFEPIAGLPEEFADYLTGAVAWQNPGLKDKGAARDAWQGLLELPPAKRRYKSVWAAFMLGKSWEKDDSDKASGYFAQVRELVKQRFVDSAGLAAASLGLEARLHLKARRYGQAIELYLDQLATDDPSAADSLRMVSSEALQQETSALVPLARNPHTQRVLTAYAVSLEPVNDSTASEQEGKPESYARRWLEAMEKAQIRDVESAGKLALLAYQRDEFKLADRWVDRAPESAVAEWVHAKLLLRQGKVEPALVLLTRLASAFPLQPRNPTNEVAPESLKDTLVVQGWQLRPAERQVLGELGVLRLTRREYLPALDALLRAGFWTDAAYVAERVLSLEELKAYVDREWPAAPAQQIADEQQTYGEDQASPTLLRKQIRYLLARRLTREIHGDEARDYYPGERVGEFDALAQSLQNGWDKSLPAEMRAQALFQAATIARTNGMELLATEVEPDWAVCGGDYLGTLTVALRATNPAAKFVVASSDELTRAAAHPADPEARFHYRYQAAALALEAANLMPNDSDQTAFVLWIAGTWLKSRDPQTANLFYRALVRRNRYTVLGAGAERKRWFPSLDANGHLLPPPPPDLSPNPALAMDPSPDNQPEAPDLPVAETGLLEALAPATSEMSENGSDLPALRSAQPGDYYVVRKGDSLASILQVLNQEGLEITLDDLFSANPELDSPRLKVGQKLFLPTRAP